MNARHTITQLTRHIRTFARWQRDSQQRTARAHCARVTQGDEAHARLDTFWLPASGTAQQGKECKRTCVLQKPEKEASNLQSSPVLSPPEGDGKRGSLHTGVSFGAGTLCPQAGPAGRPGRPAPSAGRSQPPYLLSPRLGPCSSVPADDRTAPPPGLLSALGLWGGGSGPAGAEVPPSAGGSGGWEAGDMCFLFRAPPRR